MQRRLSSTLFQILLLLAVVTAPFATSQADGLGGLSGTIATNGTPATISITCGGVTKTATTGPGGAFSITGLPAGTCTMTISASGFSTQQRAVTIATGKAAAVSVHLAAVAKQKAGETKEDGKQADAPAKVAPMESRAGAPPPPPVMPSPSPPGRMMYRPATGYAIQQQPIQQDMDRGHNTEAYDKIDDNPFQTVKAHPLSTFSVDVDTASYANARRFITEGNLPPKDAVRVEEMINYFHYDYPQPAKGEPFSITTNVTQSPWNPQMKLVRVGIKAPAIADAQVPSRNLVFLLDVSGSMSEPNKLPLLKQSMNLLVETLRAQDTIAIVTYAGDAGLALAATSGKNKEAIRNAIFRLEPGGSTNGAAGIQLAYDIAEKQKAKGSINRVILATDGDFNVGASSDGDLVRLIEKERDRGIALTVLGLGMGNMKDATLEKLADKGNGNHAYIDTISEARKVLVTEAGATLVTVAKDVKLQVEFNPTTVAGYRLVGYENRMLKDEDFNDDKKDAGDIGAGHSVTALYEIVPAGVAVPKADKVDALKYQTTSAPSSAAASAELMTVKIRYKSPDSAKSQLLSRVVTNDSISLAAASPDMRWATAMAGFGMMLRESAHRGQLTWPQVEALAKGAMGADTEGYRTQALALIQKASKLKR